MKSTLLLSFFCSVSLLQGFAQPGKSYSLKSPGGKLEMNISVAGAIQWSLKHEQTASIAPSEMALILTGGEVLGKNPAVLSAKTSSADAVFQTPIYKKAQVRDHYNQLTLNFKGDYGIIFRAYDDGAAYRFVTQRKGELTIVDETANFNFANDAPAFLPFVNDYRNKDKFTTSFEAHYGRLPISAVAKDSLAFLPALFDLGGQKKAVVLEADLQDYPGMYLTSDGQNKQGLHGVFARYPTAETTGGYNNINYVVNGRADYIAKTAGTRSFPWRVVVVSGADKELADNDMMQKLGAPSRVTDYSWIKPGKVAWDWWNSWNITHVDFKAGINVPTYKYYIDFAANNKLEYVIMDEGWSDDADLTKFKIDVQQIVDYGKQKNVGVILWSTWYAIQGNAAALMDQFSAMGVKGFKIDFIDRDDQKMVASLYDLAQKAADRHLIIDYHGMYKPGGFQRTYPNVINFEGVKGLENMKWHTEGQPEYDVSIPFIRMVAGPMDYTPGGMRNATKESYRTDGANPMTQGTRCHQMAMYPIFEAPLQMLSDNPTIYRREQECTDFIAAVPTTFDETQSLDGQVGAFVALARRKGPTWYAGAMTNWDAREITVDLSFLGNGTYKATLFEDGINADRDATDYKKTVKNVRSRDKLIVKMASGGGWAARFEKL